MHEMCVLGGLAGSEEAPKDTLRENHETDSEEGGPGPGGGAGRRVDAGRPLRRHGDHPGLRPLQGAAETNS